MENPEELLHSLAEFVKLKPKEIPADLEQYLGYVAKTGDPIYQWSLVKALFREKLLNVITEFYETCPTAGDPAPACPNVDFFNYETMKVGLVERLESFASAPFTVQRLCELLTAPRKQYSRADKFMRAVEKNMLVVSTREPGQPRVGQDVDMANGEDKSWLDRQPANASADRAVGLELAAFRYEPFSSAPGVAFFPPLKQKLDDFLETDAAVSTIAPQAANLANLAAISPEQVASLAATIGPDVANLDTEISSEVATLAAEIPPEVANLAAEIAPVVASLAAEIAPVVASLAAEIPLEVASLAVEMTPLSDANPVATISPDTAVVLATEAVSEPDTQAANPTQSGAAETDLPQEPLESETPDEKMDVDEPAVDSTNQEAVGKEASNLEGVGETATEHKAPDELPTNQDEAVKMAVGEDDATATRVNQEDVEMKPANQEQAENSPANQEDAEMASAGKEEVKPTSANEEVPMPTPANEGIDKPAPNEAEAEKLPTNDQGAEPTPQEEAKPATKESDAEKSSANEEEADRRQVQSERVQSVIRENMEREEATPPQAKLPRLDDPES